MVKKFLKSKSKRVSAKKRYKIERKVREHNRKIKKSEKLKVKSKKGRRKIIVVPGDCPFKNVIIAEANEVRENIKKAKQLQKEQSKAKRNEKKENTLKKKELSTSESELATQPSVAVSAEPKKDTAFADLLKRAQERGYHFEKYEQQKAKKDPSLKAFYKEFQQVIGDSDVIIQVLDSRDPFGTRSSEAEEAVRSQTDKKLIMVLNKCDLVPVENLQKWIAYLKQTVGCVVLPFKANTQKQKDRFGSVGTVNLTNQASMDTKKSIGVADLLGLLGTWSRGTAGGLTVGVIGMPNVGKSSLINSLKRSKACNVGAKPGVTRSCQLIHLDSKLRLVDSPGVIFSKDKGNEAMNVETILARIPKSTLMTQYQIQDFKDEEHFLSLIATKFGQMKKGGIPNPTAAEQKILHDWNTGSIKFFTEPPELPSTTISATFVSDIAQPFSLDNFQPPDEKMEDDESDDVEMEEEDVPVKRATRSSTRKAVTFAINTEELPSKKRQRKTKLGTGESSTAEEKTKLHGLVATKKTVQKKLRKSKKKMEKQASNLANLIDDINL